MSVLMGEQEVPIQFFYTGGFGSGDPLRKSHDCMGNTSIMGWSHMECRNYDTAINQTLLSVERSEEIKRIEPLAKLHIYTNPESPMPL